MRISDWSSDVCSSDLDGLGAQEASRPPQPATFSLCHVPASLCRAYALCALTMERKERCCGNNSNNSLFQTRCAGATLIHRSWRSEERRVGKECVSMC